jgi:FtsP/CotA-like multicopper oxidase with cupredoxin domain
MQLFGLEYKTNGYSSKAPFKKSYLEFSLNPRMYSTLTNPVSLPHYTLTRFSKGETNPVIISILDNTMMPDMDVWLDITLAPCQELSGNPFKHMNDNIFNFRVSQDTSEIWTLYNTDLEFFDEHPFHFHLSRGYYHSSIDRLRDNTSPINRCREYTGYRDTYSLKPGSWLSFIVDFEKYNSLDGQIPNLGYMFHCHYMMHHDMDMMGQFWVDPPSKMNIIF